MTPEQVVHCIEAADAGAVVVISHSKAPDVFYRVTGSCTVQVLGSWTDAMKYTRLDGSSGEYARFLQDCDKLSIVSIGGRSWV